MEGSFLVFAGGGEGKTAVTLGLALRAVRAGGRVSRFLKPCCEEEWKGLARLDGDLMFRHFGRKSLMDEEPGDDDFRIGREAPDEIRRAIRSGDYSLAILDDAHIAACLGLFSAEDLLALVEE